MSIRSISSTAPGLGFARPRPGAPGTRRRTPADSSVLSALSWGDREVIAAMFGSDVMTLGRDADGQAGIPPFVWQVIEDRRSGHLPAGTEITSGYLQALGSGSALLTEQALAAGLTFLGQRRQGATLDIRA
jgi:hypothetical protein